MPSFSCTVEETIPPGFRLDRYAAECLKILSRSQIKARNFRALLNGRTVKISRLLKSGDRLELFWDEAESSFLVPEDLPLDVIYEDRRVIVINKAQGMVVHPGAGNRQGTLANALLYRMMIKKGAEFPGPLPLDAIPFGAGRPGIVHRLDKDTSGVIIAAWDEEAHAFLQAQFRKRTVRKSYAALVTGCPKDSTGCIEKKIVRSRKDRKTFTVSDHEGRPSQTHYRLVKTWGAYSLLLLRPKTGRTHQIRVHLKYLGNPILGDPVYGREDPRFRAAGLMLHAKSLSLVLPSARPVPPPGGEFLETASAIHSAASLFRAPLPERFLDIIKILNRVVRQPASETKFRHCPNTSDK